ncbi:unnamed protein product [Vitrella brassicaformis CCMP3155]|uniref:Integrase catalytic domain-containing protein n=1 Tax=Vitrella brassicaformis (strain CCMP3155) TaxID=1169540 RepID=A0A0G4GU16_VITBC|nr:unnamed protein product [Vitrella brassicaformis CCMP3155]|eukprot:CEM34227.1 unnamed protein product [Vitrella brassicaformis CCMP3155]
MAQPILTFDPKTVIRAFDGGKDDWREWEVTLRAFLLAKEMPTERLMPEKEEDIPGLPVPNEDGDLDEQRTKERSVLRQLFGFLVLHTEGKAKRIIQESFDKYGENGARAYWELRKRCVPERVVCRHEVLRNFFQYQMEKDDIDDALTDFNFLAKQLSDMGEKPTDNTKIAVMVNALPPRFERFKSSLDYRFNDLTWEQFEEALRNANDRMQHARRMSQQRDRFRQKGNQNGRQHGQPHNGNRPDTYQGGNRNNERPYRDNRDSRYEWRRQPNGNSQTYNNHNNNRRNGNQWNSSGVPFRAYPSSNDGRQQQPIVRHDKDGEVIMNATRTNGMGNRNRRVHTNQLDGCDQTDDTCEQRATDLEMVGTVTAVECEEEVVNVSAVSVRPTSMMIDSGAGKTCCHQQFLFDEIKPLDRHIKIVMADGTSVPARGVGRIKYTCKEVNNGKKTVCVDGVLYVPDLKFNLFSVAHLVDQSCIEFLIGPGAAHMTATRRGDRYPLVRRGRFWYLDIYRDANDCPIYSQPRALPAAEHTTATATGRIIDPRGGDGAFPCSPADEGGEQTGAMVAEVISEKLAHQRFLHYHDAAVDRLPEVCRNAPVVKKGKKNEGEQRKCEVCVQAKMKIRPYLGNAFRHSSPGDLVHVDLAQIKQLSERGFKYLMVMVDDHSRYMQTYFLKQKSIAPKAFMHYCTAVRMPKAVRTDGGAELIAGTWKAFCEQHQIRQDQSLPHHQSQNGVAERTIGVVCQLTRAALFQSGLPPSSWCFAAKTATYIKNRMPTKTNPSEKTPFELFWGYPPCIKHIRTFGARAYVHQRKDQRGKLEPRAKLGILVGFDPNTKDGYVVWLPDDRQFVISRDVQVDEHVFPAKEKQPRGPLGIDLVHPQTPVSPDEQTDHHQDHHRAQQPEDDRHCEHQEDERVDQHNQDQEPDSSALLEGPPAAPALPPAGQDGEEAAADTDGGAADDYRVIREEEGADDDNAEHRRSGRNRLIPRWLYEDNIFAVIERLCVADDVDDTMPSMIVDTDAPAALARPPASQQTRQPLPTPQLFASKVPKTYKQAMNAFDACHW